MPIYLHYHWLYFRSKYISFFHIILAYFNVQFCCPSFCITRNRQWPQNLPMTVVIWRDKCKYKNHGIFQISSFFKCHDQNQNSTNLKKETSVIFLKYQLIHIQCCKTLRSHLYTYIFQFRNLNPITYTIIQRLINSKHLTFKSICNIFFRPNISSPW